ncbi:MAG TPA: hypothetical protein VFG15_07065 [Amycolatopsis sp.]|nr:hypothetical protein [Amycolatopsis sp.]
MDDRDERIADKRGPAGALPIRGGIRTLTGLSVPVRAEGYPDHETAALAAVDGHLGDGETVVDSLLVYFRNRRNGGVIVDERTTAWITTTGSPELTGWLFFGSAPR